MTSKRPATRSKTPLIELRCLIAQGWPKAAHDGISSTTWPPKPSQGLAEGEELSANPLRLVFNQQLDAVSLAFDHG
jgi:hypothetical protein